MKKLMLALLVVAVMMAATYGAQAAPRVALTFTVWTFAVDTIKDNIRRFQQVYPNIDVKLVDYGWGQYNDTIVANMVSGSDVPDILYSSDHWLQQWAAAGWIVPLEDHFPHVKDMAKTFSQYAVDGMTYNKKLYGLPYYADPMGFFYNERILKQAGFGRAPATWEELLQQAKVIKDRGLVRFPIGFGFSQQEPFSIEVFISMVYSLGGDLFDNLLNPQFDRPGGATIKVIEWVRDALKAGVLNPESLQWDGVQSASAMRAGTQVYTVARASALWGYNDPKQSKDAGHFRLALMPGTTRDTVGFVRFYAMSSQVPRRGPDALDAAWKFLNYFGGPGPDNSYPVVRRWAIDFGLGFAQMPLYKDRDIIQSFSKWVDVQLLQYIGQRHARVKQGLTPWFAQWDVFSRAELQKAYLGQQTPEQTVRNMAQKWNELRGRR
ncbi:MAG: sugar ABC transporter substrate-binding protein [Armatimonadota bacterium]|nr:sugar ABC transporter substrate-binding protein [Armatimonadota bacterium]